VSTTLLFKILLLLVVFNHFHNHSDALRSATFWFVGLLVAAVALGFEYRDLFSMLLSFVLAFMGSSLLDRLGRKSAYWVGTLSLFALLAFI
jgi:hypothetical protein